MQMRIRVAEECHSAEEISADPHTFTYQANLSVFKVAYPFPPKNIVFPPLLTPCMSTYGGQYTDIPGYLVTERVSHPGLFA